MHPHYSNEDGRQRQIDAFLKQEITTTERKDKTDRATIAAAFAHAAKVTEYNKGQELFSAEKRSYTVFFVFTGSVDLLVGKKRIYRAMPGAILGEFPVLDGELTNVVTATTREVSDIASIPYEQFRKIADEHPAIVWRNLARILALRIRDRNASEADWFGSFGELKVSNVIKLMSAVPTVWKVVVFTVAGLTALGAWYNWLWTVTKTVAKP